MRLRRVDLRRIYQLDALPGILSGRSVRLVGGAIGGGCARSYTLDQVMLVDATTLS
jgi:hypothetical protein